jgi:hypothetical protein
MRTRTPKLLAIAMVLATRAVCQTAEPADAIHPVGLASLAVAAPKKAEKPDLSPFEGSTVEAPAMAPFRVVVPSVVVFRSRDLYTTDGKADQAFKAHPGLVVGNAFNLNKNAAYEMFLADDWRGTKSDYWDMAHAMAQGGDRREGRMILNEINDEDVRMRAEAEEDAAAPAIGRFQIATAETGTKLLEAPEQTLDVPFVRKSW